MVKGMGGVKEEYCVCMREEKDKEPEGVDVKVGNEEQGIGSGQREGRGRCCQLGQQGGVPGA